MAMSLGTSSGKKLSNTIGFVYRDHCPENSDCKVAGEQITLGMQHEWKVCDRTHTHMHACTLVCAHIYGGKRATWATCFHYFSTVFVERSLTENGWSTSPGDPSLPQCWGYKCTLVLSSHMSAGVQTRALLPVLQALYQLSCLPSPHQLSFNDWPLTHSVSISWKPTMCQVLCWVLNNTPRSEHQTVVSPGTGNMQRKCLCILHHTNSHESHILKCP